jgi:methylmalonyl-CoA mutase N-terminal domain/subunit
LEHLTDKIGDVSWDLFKKLESYNEIHSPKKIELIVSMVNKTVKIRTENFEKKAIKLIGLNVFKNSKPADNEWIIEPKFLGMESFRYEKIECK